MFDFYISNIINDIIFAGVIFGYFIVKFDNEIIFDF